MSGGSVDPRERFSTRVENYVRYRPGYPGAVVDAIAERCGSVSASCVADIGSGTGIFSRLLLDRGFSVYGVEPNAEMRAAAESLLAGEDRFTSVHGSAECTTLPDASVDVVTAAQAFHWFKGETTRTEWSRILRPRGLVALVWNVRNVGASELMSGYEALLRELGTDYAEVSHEGVDDARLRALYGHGAFERLSFPNAQTFDFAGLVGRVESASYAPEAGHSNYVPMMQRLRQLFEASQSNGTVAFEYETRLFIGPIVSG